MIERQRFAPVEDGQVVVGVAEPAGSHRDIGSRVPPPVSALPGAGFQFLQCGGDDDAGRQPVVLTELTGRQQGACGGEKGVVVALPKRCGCRPEWRLARVCRSTQGVSSAELHMPGAASLANTASNVARASGVRYPLIGAHPIEILVCRW